MQSVLKNSDRFFCQVQNFIQLSLAGSNAEENLRIERDAIQKKYDDLMQDVEKEKVEMGRWKVMVCDYPGRFLDGHGITQPCRSNIRQRL